MIGQLDKPMVAPLQAAYAHPHHISVNAYPTNGMELMTEPQLPPVRIIRPPSSMQHVPRLTVEIGSVPASARIRTFFPAGTLPPCY